MSGQDRVFLAAAGRWTTRAGFGCSGLMGALSSRESLALLSAAWDAGIRHFDVAPLYGHGEAERILGSFLASRRQEATIVTKFGIEPTGNSMFREIARAVARPLLRKASVLRPRSTGNTSNALVREPFDPRKAERSLARSLRALQTDRIDVLLLHEAEAQLLPGDGVLAFLENSVKKGLIGAFGIGGDSGKASDMVQSRPGYCPVVQRDWSLFEDEVPHYPGSDLIVFGVLARRRHAQGPVNGGEAVHIGAEVILRATAIALPNSVILFSSRNAAHVISSARALTDVTLESDARNLLASAGKSLIHLCENSVPAPPGFAHAPGA
jgi:D-threo-aldose 1-dehydrogenase